MRGISAVQEKLESYWQALADLHVLTESSSGIMFATGNNSGSGLQRLG
jgi:hypothetical protein